MRTIEARRSRAGARPGAGLLALTALLGGGAGSGIGAPATAQNGQKSASALGEIVVTAQKRAQNLQSTPLAITAIGTTALAQANAVSLLDVQRLAPNVVLTGSTGQVNFFIRGIGQQQITVFADPGVTAYVDGVYHPRLSANTTTLADVAQIEVLRGPQGTLFGRNATGGALNITTTAPAPAIGGSLGVRHGSRNDVKLDAAVNVPLSRTLALRLDGERQTQDGYMHDLATGAYLNDVNFFTLRGALRWNATPDLDVTLRGDWTNQRQNGEGSKLLSASPYRTGSWYTDEGTAPQYDNAADRGISLTEDWRVGPGALKSITAYRGYTSSWAGDIDATPAAIVNTEKYSSDRFFSQEVNYNASLLQDRLEATIGVFYLADRAQGADHARLGSLDFRADNFYSQFAPSYAAYAQLTYKLTDALSVIMGVRGTHDEKKVSFDGITNTAPPIVQSYVNDWTAITPKFGVQYQMTPRVMSYATASEGYKAGGYNSSPIQPSDFRSFQPEHVWSYELGLKSEWFERRLRANFAAYYTDYSNIQVDVTPEGHLYVDNVGNARIDGVEGDLALVPLTDVLLTANFGVADFRYTHLNASAATAGITSGAINPGAPKYSANLGGQYTLPLDDASLVLHADYSYHSRIYYDAANTRSISQGIWGYGGARISYARPHFTLYLYGTNLGDAQYHVNGNDAFGPTVVNPGAPREVGVGLTLPFG